LTIGRIPHCSNTSSSTFVTSLNYTNGELLGSFGDLCCHWYILTRGFCILHEYIFSMKWIFPNFNVLEFDAVTFKIPVYFFLIKNINR
jgi:hypothetical protein